MKHPLALLAVVTVIRLLTGPADAQTAVDSFATLKRLNDRVSEMRKTRPVSSEAKQLAREAVELGRRAHSESLEYARAIRSLIELNDWVAPMFARGLKPEAISLAQQAVAVVERSFGPEHLETAEYLEVLAGALRPSDAISIYQRVIGIRQRLLPEAHPSISQAGTQLATVLELEGDRLKQRDELGGALKAFEMSVQMHERYYGRDHVRTDLARSKLVSLFKELGEFSRALRIAQQVVESMESRHVPSVVKAIAVGDLAEVQQKLGENQTAADLLEKALSLLALMDHQ